MDVILALKIMAIGMAGIFVFMLFFWLIIVLLQRVFPYKDRSGGEGA